MRKTTPQPADAAGTHTYPGVVELDTFTVAIPISASFTRHVELQAPTEEAALLLAKEHALDTGVLMHSEPWIVKKH